MDKDISNIRSEIRKETLNELSPLHALFNEVEAEDGLWTHDVRVDEGEKIPSLFLALRSYECLNSIPRSTASYTSMVGSQSKSFIRSLAVCFPRFHT